MSGLTLREYLLIDVIKKHQWSGTAYGSGGSTARRCPDCGGIHPDDALHLGGGQYEIGKGHKADCIIALAISTGNE